jgi:predicted DNA-binding transcriptional regulator AlpA
MRPEARDLIRAVLEAPEKAAAVSPSQVPAVLGQLAELQAIFLARLVSQNGSHSASVPSEPDRFLTAEEAAPVLGVTPRWLYRHSRKLPFARRLSRKALRFSEAGLRRWAAARRA